MYRQVHLLHGKVRKIEKIVENGKHEKSTKFAHSMICSSFHNFYADKLR